MTQTLLKQTALVAFCASCPTPEDVTAFLAREGLDLDCAIAPLTWPQSRAAPAQYHYRDAEQTEVIYLAGKDHPEGKGGKFPAHASRWWLYPGKNPVASQRLAHALSSQWQLEWRPTDG